MCERGAICKFLLMREVLPSVLTPLHWLEALALPSPPALLAPAKSKENKK